jgi:glutaconate CoA-transferase subunit A
MKPISLEAMAESVPDGALIALPPDYSLPPCALGRALIRRGAKELRVLGVPITGFVTDLLIGAGCVAEVESSAVTLGEAGFAPRFSAAVRSGSIRMRDATCPAIHAALQASEKGVPFMPLRGVIGSDILAHRPDWKVARNPFAPQGEEDPILLVPAIQPDIAAFHAVMADAHGNVWVGRRREVATIAHAARRCLVTVERVVPGNMLEDERLAPGCISAIYVDSVAVAERGTWPSGLLGEYAADAAHLMEYAKQAASAAGFREYLDEHVFTSRAQAAE